MAEVQSVVLALSRTEARAVYRALGNMRGSDYPTPEMAEAGSAVYDELTPLTDEG
jgi:hypothetical protein